MSWECDLFGENKECIHSFLMKNVQLEYEGLT
jgi:hypothetical protein